MTVLVSAAELLAVGRRPVLLDVRWALGDDRGREKYLAGHLPGRGLRRPGDRARRTRRRRRPVGTRCRRYSDCNQRRGAGGSAPATPSSPTTPPAAWPRPAPGGCCAGAGWPTSGCSTADWPPGGGPAGRWSPATSSRSPATSRLTGGGMPVLSIDEAAALPRVRRGPARRAGGGALPRRGRADRPARRARARRGERADDGEPRRRTARSGRPTELADRFAALGVRPGVRSASTAAPASRPRTRSPPWPSPASRRRCGRARGRSGRPTRTVRSRPANPPDLLPWSPPGRTCRACAPAARPDLERSRPAVLRLAPPRGRLPLSGPWGPDVSILIRCGTRTAGRRTGIRLGDPVDSCRGHCSAPSELRLLSACDRGRPRRLARVPRHPDVMRAGPGVDDDVVGLRQPRRSPPTRSRRRRPLPADGAPRPAAEGPTAPP